VGAGCANRIEQISGDTTYNGTDIGTALGAYLQGEELTPGQIQVVNIGLSEFPFPGAAPPILKLPVTQPAVPPTTPTAPTVPPAKPAPPVMVKIPTDLIGQSQEAAFGILSSAGLHAKGTPVVTGKTLIVKTVSPKEGTSVAKGSTVTLTSALQK
jgi:hypothetical protein